MVKTIQLHFGVTVIKIMNDGVTNTTDFDSDNDGIHNTNEVDANEIIRKVQFLDRRKILMIRMEIDFLTNSISIQMETGR